MQVNQKCYINKTYRTTKIEDMFIYQIPNSKAPFWRKCMKEYKINEDMQVKEVQKETEGRIPQNEWYNFHLTVHHILN